jgi:hypothetical protein
MKLWILGAALAATVTTAASAQTVTSDAFDQPAPSWAKVVTFDSPLPSGFSLYGGKIVQGSVPGQYAAPAGDATKYLTTGAGQQSAVVADKGYQSVGFYWGSIDTYNSVSLYDSLGKLIAKFTGADLPPAGGDQTSGATNRYVSYTLDPGSLIAGIRAIVFESAGNAFEVDNVAFGTAPGSPAPVPEPATMGLFGIGLAAMGRRALKKRAA